MMLALNYFTFSAKAAYTARNNTPQACFSALPGSAQTEGLLISGNMLFCGVLS